MSQARDNNTAGTVGVAGKSGGLAGSFLVTDSQRAELLSLPLASHQLKFDEAELRELLADTISLSFVEKKKTLTILGKLSQAQLDELLAILREEREKLKSLDQEQRSRLSEIDTQGRTEQEVLARELAEKLQQEKDSTEIQRIRDELFGSGQ